MRASTTEDLKGFQNPTDYWEHVGPYSIELAPEAGTNMVPPGTEVRGNIVTVFEGYMKQTLGKGIQFYSRGIPFYWRNAYIKVVRNQLGEPLWVNHDHLS